MVISKRHIVALVWMMVGAITRIYAGSTDKPVEISFQFSVFARSEISRLVYLPQAKQGVKGIQFYASSRSPLYTYRGGEQMAFYEADGSGILKSAALGESPQPVAIYTVPPGMKRALLLFFPKSVVRDDGIKYEVYGLSDDIDKIPGGHVVIVNASMASYAGAVGSRVVSIPLGVSGPFLAKNDTLLRLWRVDRPNSPPVIQENWNLADRQRLIMVLFPPYSPTGRTPIVRRLDDMLPAQLPGVRVALP
jgi:hypothetical protein